MTANWSDGTDLTPHCFRQQNPTRKNTSVQPVMYLGGITPMSTPGYRTNKCEKPSLNPWLQIPWIRLRWYLDDSEGNPSGWNWESKDQQVCHRFWIQVSDLDPTSLDLCIVFAELDIFKTSLIMLKKLMIEKITKNFSYIFFLLESNLSRLNM